MKEQVESICLICSSWISDVDEDVKSLSIGEDIQAQLARDVTVLINIKRIGM